MSKETVTQTLIFLVVVAFLLAHPHRPHLGQDYTATEIFIDNMTDLLVPVCALAWWAILNAIRTFCGKQPRHAHLEAALLLAVVFDLSIQLLLRVDEATRL